MTIKSVFAHFLFIFVLGLTIVSAQTGTFTYQGRLTDTSMPATGTYDLELALFDALTGGAQIGTTQTVTGVTVTGGIFTANLNFTAAAFPGAERFLEIRVKRPADINYTPLMPRQPLTSTPYAIRALNAGTADTATNATNAANATNADTLDSLDSGSFVQTNTTAFIRNQTTAQTADFNVSGIGTANILNAATRYDINGSRVLSVAGMQNVFAGVGAGASNTTGQENSFFGRSAGSDNTTGRNNSFFGRFAGLANTEGADNSFFGHNSGGDNTTGTSNSFFGRGAGTANRTGSSNSFFGGLAGTTNTTGGSNSFFGVFAGLANTEGTSNSFFGRSAGDSNTTGSNNTIIGNIADVGSGNLSFASAIGAGAVVSNSNTVVLGRAADAVQIPGTLNVAGTLSGGIFNAATQYNIGGSRLLSIAGTNNIFAGVGSGQANTTGFDNSFVGANAGLSNTAGVSNSFFGAFAGMNNTTGNSNSFVGNDAGRNNSTGSGNSFVGASAGLNNTTGASNSFFGARAGFGNTTGASNSFVGTFAGEVNTTGNNNSFVGERAGSSNTTGSSNSFFGASAGNKNTTGFNNSFVGESSGSNNTIGNSDSFFGRSAGFNNTTGNDNLFAGTSAGFSNTAGNDNSFFGRSAGFNNTTGISNSFVGRGAGSINTTGSNNTLIGFGANLSQNNLTNAAAIGSRAFVSLNNSLILGSIAGVNDATDDTNVGIGTTAPLAKLHITANGGNVLVGDPGCGPGFEGIGFAASFLFCSNYSIMGNGTDTIVNRPTGGTIRFRENNLNQMTIAAGGNVGIGTSTPARRLHISGVGTDGPGRNDVQITGTGTTGAGITFESTADGGREYSIFSSANSAGSGGGDLAFFDVTDAAYRMVISSTGNVGIGTTAPTQTLDVNGRARVRSIPMLASIASVCNNAAGDLVACGASSLRWKTNVNSFSDGLNVLRQLRPISYNWKDGGAYDIGLGAEDVATVAPFFASRDKEGVVEGVRYERLNMLLINAVNQQQDHIEVLDKRNQSQQKQIDQQRKQIESLTKIVCASTSKADICQQ